MSGMTAETYASLDGAALPPALQAWSATPVFTTEALEVALCELADAFGRLWSQRLDRPVTLPAVTLDASQLNVRFDNGLTLREREIAATPEGSAAVESELHRQVDSLYPILADRVEQLLNCFVAESHLHIDFAENTVNCTVTLRDLPRIVA